MTTVTTVMKVMKVMSERYDRNETSYMLSLLTSTGKGYIVLYAVQGRGSMYH